MQSEHRYLGIAFRHRDDELHQEPVQLGFRQRIGALVLHRVLGSRDEERVRQPPAFAVSRYLALLHRLQQGCLSLRWCAVDLVRQQEVGEDRPGAKLELARACVVHQRSGEVTRHEIGGELHALGVEPQGSGKGAHQERFGHPGYPFQENVAARQERDKETGDGAVLTDHRLVDLGADSVHCLSQSLIGPCGGD